MESARLYGLLYDLFCRSVPFLLACCLRAYVGSDDISQVALNRFEALKSLEEALDTITTKMAYCQFFATMYAKSLQIALDSDETTVAFREGIESALPEFYAAVLVFSVKATAYFRPSGSGKLSHLPSCTELRLRIL